MYIIMYICTYVYHNVYNDECVVDWPGGGREEGEGVEGRSGGEEGMGVEVGGGGGRVEGGWRLKEGGGGVHKICWGRDAQRQEKNGLKR